MQKYIHFLQLAAIIVLNCQVSNTLGWLLTDFKSPIFDFKPFNCRPCLTFWLTNVLGFVFAALAYLPLAFYGAVLVSAFINYIIINSKIEINE